MESAGILRRGVARGIDLLLFQLGWDLLDRSALATSPDMLIAFSRPVVFCLSFWALERFCSGSPGKWMLGLRVRSPSGVRAGTAALLVRSFLLTGLFGVELLSGSEFVADALQPLLAAAIAVLGWMSADRLLAHDLASATRVMDVRTVTDADPLLPPTETRWTPSALGCVATLLMGWALLLRAVPADVAVLARSVKAEVASLGIPCRVTAQINGTADHRLDVDVRQRGRLWTEEQRLRISPRVVEMIEAGYPNFAIRLSGNIGPVTVTNTAPRTR